MFAKGNMTLSEDTRNASRPRLNLVLGAILALSVGTTVSSHFTSPGVADPSRVPVSECFEFTVAKDADYGLKTNLFGVTLDTTFTAPSGTNWSIRGFYFDTHASGQSLWKCRFAPNEVGTWSFAWRLVHASSATTNSGTGAFICIAGPNPGFLETNPANPFRWRLPDGDAVRAARDQRRP